MGFVGYSAMGYNKGGELVEWPFLAAIFAVMLAAPLFQAARDAGTWRLAPMVVQMHAWTDAVIGATSLLFVGISFGLFGLIAGLFHLIGIDFLSDLFEEAWFYFVLGGFAFGAAVGMLRERDALVATMQKLVRTILSVLAPVLAFALVMFLLSLLLDRIGRAVGRLGIGGGADVGGRGGLFHPAQCRDRACGWGGKRRRRTPHSPSPPHLVLLWSALILALVVLPLAALADTALLLRVGQYGWTPERIWGVLCALIATAYGLAGWWAVIRQRMQFSPLLRVLETRLAAAVVGLALLLSLPIIDFGAISARDQLARLQSGAVKAAEFDWAAMAFDFGPAGRDALTALARGGASEQRTLADVALKAESRYEITNRPVDAG